MTYRVETSAFIFHLLVFPQYKQPHLALCPGVLPGGMVVHRRQEQRGELENPGS